MIKMKILTKTLHPILIPSSIGSALIVSTDDHISTDILLVVTDISLSWLLGSVSELAYTILSSFSYTWSYNLYY